MRSGSLLLRSDEHHEQFVRANQGQSGPCADQRTDGAVSQAVSQVGADRRDDRYAEAPCGQAWYAQAAAAGVEDDH